MHTQGSHRLTCRLRAGRLMLVIALIGGSAISAGIASAAPPEQTQQTATHTVSIKIQNFKFVPATVAVVPGTRIVWTNLDEVAHSVVSDNGAFSASSPLNKGDAYSVVLSIPGDYLYHCGIHSFMQGTIRVIAARSGDSGLAQP